MSEIEISYMHCTYDDDGEVEDEIELIIELGHYDKGEGASWGYYGGSPGSPAEAEPGDISTLEPDEAATARVTAERGPDYLKGLSGFNTFEVRNGVLYKRVPWTGDVSDLDGEEIEEMLIKAAQDYNPY